MTRAGPAPRAVRAVVSGRVQGVWFRDSTRREAERLGVRGWVRNLASGGVEIHAEGGAEAVEALVAWARGGPPRAEVERLEVEDVLPEGHAAFVVRR
jgi:acylphosphatase